MASTGLKVDSSDPNVRRLVYNMYRGMLCNYNDKANDILGSKPKELVREDQGIARQLESMIRQSSQISGGGTPSPGPGAPSGDGVTANSAPSFPAPPAPPPPPPPGSGQLPSVRINTEIPDSRGQQRGSTYEPPAAIQNAMMTKDKKPFTYTPGGLDLSQIRSPRMQRRITRNAAAEGVGEQPAAPKQSPLAQQPHAPLPPSAMAAMQPQLPVAVFPQGQMPQLHHVGAPPGYHQPPPPPPPPAPSSPPSQPTVAIPKAPAPPSPAKVEPPIPSPPVPQNEPGSIYVPPAPQKGQGSIYVPPTTPQNEPGSIYVPPVQTARAQMGSLYIPPINNTTQQESPSPQRQTPQTPMSPIHPALNKAPTPWLTQRAQPQPQAPAWVREEQQQPGARIIPIQVHGMVEGRDPPQPPPQTSQSPQPTTRVQSPQQSAQTSNTRIIPIQVEGRDPPQQQQQQQQYQQQQQQQQQQQHQYQQQQRRPVYVHNKFNPQSPPPSPSPVSNHNEIAGPQSPRPLLQQQQSWGGGGPNSAPIQSRSFRVLQKITDTDNQEDQSEQNQQYGNQWAPQQQTQGVPVQELRKLQLSDDDRALMDKFKAQVSEDLHYEEENPRYRGGHIPSRVFKMLDESVDVDTFLHSESDPRYRGASIPSRAFRMLQTMTDGAGGDYPEQQQVPRGAGPPGGPQGRAPSSVQSAADSPPQPYIPPSEQQVQEPKKYTGGAIPSRSFRMLQAMTASPENCANVPSPDGRETPVSIAHQGYDPNSAGPWGHYDPNVPPYPPPYWGPEAWWGYYPPPPDMENQPQLPQQQQQQQQQQQHQQQQQIPPTPPPYWDPYSAMYAYMAEMNAAYGYPPMPYPPVYSPHHFAPPRSFRYPLSGSDSDECSGYSSTDEMAYYGAKFARGPSRMGGIVPPQQNGMLSCTTPSIVVTPTNENIGDQIINEAQGSESSSSIKSNDDSSNLESSSSYRDQSNNSKESNGSYDDNETSDSDTEVEDDAKSDSQNEKGSSSGLQMIRSVSDINIYANNNSSSDVLSRGSETNDDETEREDDTEDDDDEDEDEEEDLDQEKNSSYVSGDDCIPHQLSVIFEESEISDAESVKKEKQSNRSSDNNTISEDGDSSTATLDNCDEESDADYDVLDTASSTVTVRLPLKLKFSRSENDGDVTTIIVGDSQVKSSEDKDPVQPSKPEENNTSKNDNPNVSVTFSFPSRSNSGNRVEHENENMTSHASPTFENSKSLLPRSASVDSTVTRQMSSDELDVYETCEESDSDVSVCLSLPLKKKPSLTSPRSTPPTISNISEEEDDDVKTKTEESDSTMSHWEDDSSSSTKTVKLASDSSKAVKKTGSDIKEQPLSNKTLPAEKTNPVPKVNQVRHNEAESEEESDSEDESSTSSSCSHSSRSCVSSKETDSEKKEVISASSNKVTAESRKEAEKEVESSEESEESQDEDESNLKKGTVAKAKAAVPNVGDGVLTATKNVEKRKSNTETGKDSELVPKSGDDSRLNRSKSLEESEEDDSGVTSDMSRQISDADTDGDSNLNELMTQCQRVATHSRLFKLLQDECGNSDDEDEEDESYEQQSADLNKVCEQPLTAQAVGTLKSRKEHLSLPLQQNSSSDPDSLSSSSGVTSPASPTVTDRLVKELVQSLLQRKKGRRFKKLPLAKLHAAALRILQEDMDPYDTVSSAGSEEGNSNFYLPHVNSRVQPQHSNYFDDSSYASQTNNNTANPMNVPNQVMYGANYYDYCDYYDSWAHAAAYYGDPAFEYNIVPSRAFKLLQEHAQPSGFSTGVINGLWAKCPRIPNSKHIHSRVAATIDRLNKTGPGQSDM